MLLCDRPHAKTIDFVASRFVVSSGIGLNVNGVHLERGDLIPEGALTQFALREVYEPPIRKIELLEYAKTDPDLCQACADRGIDLGDGNKTRSGVLPVNPTQSTPQGLKTPPSDPQGRNNRLAAERQRLESFSGRILAKLCRDAGVRCDGPKETLRNRLLDLVE